MPDRSTTRRSFFGLSAGAAFLCTIGGREVRLDDPDAARKADALAAQVPRPPGAAPEDALTFPTPEPQPGGRKREYWVQARTRGWDVAPTGRDDWHGRPIPGKRNFRALVYQLMKPGFAAPNGPPLDARARRSTPRSATRSSCTSATPPRRSTRRSRCTRTASATRPTTTASTSASTRAWAASSRPARSSPTRGRRRRTRSASGRTTTTARTTRSTRSAARSARS